MMRLGLVFPFVVIMCLTVQIRAIDECREKTKHIIDDYYASLLRPYMSREFRPWRYPSAPNHLETSLKTNGEKFQYSIDVMYFDPSDLTVKIHDGFVVVDAKHEEKKDEHGFVSRQFVRRYPLPDDVKPEEIIAELSTDGILSVTAPRITNDKAAKDRFVNIIITGPKRNEDKYVPQDKADKYCKDENCADE